VERYADACGSRDAERVVALHSEDSVFRLFVDGAAAANGRAAILAQFRQILSDNPGYRSTVRSVMFGSDFVVIGYDIHMDPPKPFAFGNTRYVPTDRAYAIPAIDAIYFRNGLVTVKHTYLDTAVIGAHSRRANRVRW
jgi:SnoaL-like domain